MAARLIASFLLFLAVVRAAPVDDAFVKLYNFDFAGAHQVIDGQLAQKPDDPFLYALRAATHLFYELDRLKILEAEFVVDDKKISGDDILVPDPKVREAIFASIEKSQALADGRLKQHPGETMSLFSYCLTEGIRTDYMAFIEKKQFRSLFAAKKSQNYAVEIIKRDPAFVDALLTTGISEYLVGSLPFFLRWFVRFDQVKGSKEQAVKNLEKVSVSGRYLGPYARIMLAIIHLREKRPQRCIQLLDELSRQFPGNPLLRKELVKLREKFSSGPAR